MEAGFGFHPAGEEGRSPNGRGPNTRPLGERSENIFPCVCSFQDARPEVEFDVSHIAGARRVSPEGTDVSETMKDLMMKAETGTSSQTASVGIQILEPIQGSRAVRS